MLSGKTVIAGKKKNKLLSVKKDNNEKKGNSRRRDELSEEKQKKKQGKKTKKKSKKRNGIIRNMVPGNLFREIKGYGYDYSFKKYMLTVAITMAGMLAAGYLYKLKVVYMMILAVFSMICMPTIILAQFRYIHSNDRFEQLVAYLDQMILSFKQHPKILMAMEASLEMAEGKMKECIESAINVLKTDSESTDVYEKAFSIIEKEYRCSRLRTMHRFMLNVEKINSKSYQESIDNLYSDIRNWVTRTYQYQKQLKSIKTKIIIIMGLSLTVAAFFTQILLNMQDSLQAVGESFKNNLDITASAVYQIATILYIGCFIAIYTLMCTKIHGNWLVNDISFEKEEKVSAMLEKVENYQHMKSTAVSLAVSSVMLAVAFAMYFLLMNRSEIVLVIGGLLAIFIALKPKITYDLNKKKIEKELCKEFPIWLRDIAVNLNNMVVVRSISESYENAAPVLKPFLLKFLKETECDPNSIKPYINFFGMFNVSEMKTAVKTLYSIRVLGKEDARRQINDLISRNQALLEESEKMRNEDALAGTSFLSLIPMILMCFKLMLDMGVVMLSFMGLMSSIPEMAQQLN